MFSFTFTRTVINTWLFGSSSSLPVRKSQTQSSTVEGMAAVNRTHYLKLAAYDISESITGIAALVWDLSPVVRVKANAMQPPGCFACERSVPGSLYEECYATVGKTATDTVSIKGYFEKSGNCLVRGDAITGLPLPGIPAGLGSITGKNNLLVTAVLPVGMEVVEFEGRGFERHNFSGLVTETALGEPAAVMGRGAALTFRTFDATGATVKGDYHTEYMITGRPVVPPGVPGTFAADREIRTQKTYARGGIATFTLDTDIPTRDLGCTGRAPCAHAGWYVDVLAEVPLRKKTGEVNKLYRWQYASMLGPVYFMRQAARLRAHVVLGGKRHALGVGNPPPWVTGYAFELHVSAVDTRGILASHPEDLGSDAVVVFRPVAIPCIDAELSEPDFVHKTCVGASGTCEAFPLGAVPRCGNSGWALGNPAAEQSGETVQSHEITLSGGVAMIPSVAYTGVREGLTRFMLTTQSLANPVDFMAEITFQRIHRLSLGGATCLPRILFPDIAAFSGAEGNGARMTEVCSLPVGWTGSLVAPPPPTPMPTSAATSSEGESDAEAAEEAPEEDPTPEPPVPTPQPVVPGSRDWQWRTITLNGQERLTIQINVVGEDGAVVEGDDSTVVRLQSSCLSGESSFIGKMVPAEQIFTYYPSIVDNETHRLDTVAPLNFRATRGVAHIADVSFSAPCAEMSLALFCSQSALDAEGNCARLNHVVTEPFCVTLAGVPCGDAASEPEVKLPPATAPLSCKMQIRRLPALKMDDALWEINNFLRNLHQATFEEAMGGALRKSMQHADAVSLRWVCGVPSHRADGPAPILASDRTPCGSPDGARCKQYPEHEACATPSPAAAGRGAAALQANLVSLVVVAEFDVAINPRAGGILPERLGVAVEEAIREDLSSPASALHAAGALFRQTDPNDLGFASGVTATPVPTVNATVVDENGTVVYVTEPVPTPAPTPDPASMAPETWAPHTPQPTPVPTPAPTPEPEPVPAFAPYYADMIWDTPQDLYGGAHRHFSAATTPRPSALSLAASTAAAVALLLRWPQP